MEENTRKLLRREGNTQGGLLLIYMGIMNVTVVVALLVSMCFRAFRLAFEYGGIDVLPEILESLLDDAVSAGEWGYILSIAIGIGMLLLWKKPAYVRNTILQSGRKMRAKDFILLTVIFFTGQQLFQWWYLLLERLGNWLGISMEAILESGAVDTEHLPMFLYAGLLGPIAEEILFRGVVLRSLQPYGKKFAIFVSALLFGLFHGNLMQAPFAFVVGLVLGYVALEYHIYWAMLLHVINNLGFADLLPRALALLPAGMDDLIITVFLLVCTVLAVVILISRWRQVRDYWKENPTGKGTYAAFFRAPAMVVFLVITIPVMLLALPILALLS